MKFINHIFALSINLGSRELETFEKYDHSGYQKVSLKGIFSPWVLWRKCMLMDKGTGDFQH